MTSDFASEVYELNGLMAETGEIPVVHLGDFFVRCLSIARENRCLKRALADSGPDNFGMHHEVKSYGCECGVCEAWLGRKSEGENDG